MWTSITIMQRPCYVTVSLLKLNSRSATVFNGDFSYPTCSTQYFEIWQVKFICLANVSVVCIRLLHDIQWNFALHVSLAASVNRTQVFNHKVKKKFCQKVLHYISLSWLPVSTPCSLGTSCARMSKTRTKNGANTMAVYPNWCVVFYAQNHFFPGGRYVCLIWHHGRDNMQQKHRATIF